ncbi:hypothetical protein [Pleionea sediminis]|uniref:hypothetical protein n=1 Tax=Pleionea sediminis TaxID=2569479 RepID=UPI001185F2D7|nr:hypothetical protein [Pleionea sediminis]
MTAEEFSQWGIIFAISAAAAALALGILVFYSMLQDKRAGISVVIAFALAGIGKAAKYYLLSAIAVVLMLPMVAFYCYKQWKKPVIWINWLVLMICTPIAYYAYSVMYTH